jgi:cell wall-associated NlpC family hydrolase
MVKAERIVALARETLGTPYRHQGRINGLALDCAGVPVHVGHRIGMPLTDFTRYGRLPIPIEMRASLDAHLLRVPKERIQIGDVAWIKFREEPQHLAIVGDHPLGLSLIHAYNGSGFHSVVEHRLDDEWMTRIVAVWRYPGVEL